MNCVKIASPNYLFAESMVFFHPPKFALFIRSFIFLVLKERSNGHGQSTLLLDCQMYAGHPLPRRLVLVGIPNKPLLSDGIGWDILWHNGVMGKSSFLMGISSTSKNNGSNSQLKGAQLVSIRLFWPTPTTQSQHGIVHARQEFQGFMLWAPFEGAVILLFEDASFVSK